MLNSLSNSLGMTTDPDLKGLAPTFQTAISTILDTESQPIKDAQAAKDALAIRKGMYTDIKTSLDTLQASMKALISTDDTFLLKPTPKMTVTPGVTGATVLSATMGTSASYADYNITVNHLAKAQTRVSIPFISPEIALGKSGLIWLGGDGSTQTATVAPADPNVAAAGVSAVATGQRELGTGAYSVQIRDLNGVKQFRMVNADGQTVSVASTAGDNTFTTNWQSVSAASSTYNTGRGMTFDLNSNAAPGSTAVNYVAKGVSVSINATDTMRTIVNAINAASQPEGREMKASIIGNQLVFAAASTGLNHTMIYTDGTSNGGLGFTNTDLQAAADADLTVNGLHLTRSSNNNLTDVADGVTLSLAADSENKSALLSVAADNAKSAGGVQNFVKNFNATFKYLTDKMASTSKVDPTTNKTTYTRGGLAGDDVFRTLRSKMLSTMSARADNAGSFKRLSDIGISFDKNLVMTVDNTKLQDALTNHASDLSALLDTVMGKFNTTLSSFTGGTGSLQRNLSSMDTQTKNFTQRMTSYQKTLDSRKKSLINEYLTMQSELANLGSQAQSYGFNIDQSY